MGLDTYPPTGDIAHPSGLLTALRAGPPFCWGGTPAGARPEGGPFQRIGTYVHTRKKFRWISTPALYGILVSVYVSMYLSVGWRALAWRGCSKKDSAIVAVPRARRCGGYRGIWIDRVPCARRCGGLRDVVQGDYLQLPLSGRGRRRRAPSEKKRKAVERKAIPKWSQSAVATWLGRGVAEASALRICEAVSTRN